MNVSNIIKDSTHTINVNFTIEKVLELMSSFNQNGIPVVNDNNKLVGMVVKADIYRFMIQPGHYDSCPVDWVMSKSVVVAHPNEDLVTVAKRLRENNIIAMPVVDNDEVVGIISIEDLLDYFINQ